MKRQFVCLFAFFIAGQALASVPEEANKRPLPLAKFAAHTEAFKKCVDDNQSPIFPANKLVNLCLERHTKSFDSKLIDASGAYVKSEKQGIIFAVRIKNNDTKNLITSFNLTLNHRKAPQAQQFRVGPISLLPGEETTLQFSNLNYEPDNLSKETSADFSFAIDDAKGIELRLK